MALGHRPLASAPLAGYLGSAPPSGNTIAVPAGALTLTGYAPTVLVSAHQTVSVPAGALTITGIAPTVSVSGHQTIAVPAGALTLAGQVPTVLVSDNKTVAVPVGALTLTGYAPTVDTGGPQTIAVPAGLLTLTGYAPEVSNGEAQTGGGVAMGLYWPQPSRDKVRAVPRKARRIIERVSRETSGDDVEKTLRERLEDADLKLDAAYLDMVEALQARQIATLQELVRLLDAERAREQDDEDAILLLML